MINCINLDELSSAITEQVDLFICSSSYENRCFSVASKLPRKKVGYAIICANRDYDEHISDNLNVFNFVFSQRQRIVINIMVNNKKIRFYFIHLILNTIL